MFIQIQLGCKLQVFNDTKHFPVTKFSQHTMSPLYQNNFYWQTCIENFDSWCFKGPNELLNSVLYLAYYKHTLYKIFQTSKIYAWCILVCEYLCMGNIIYFDRYSSKKQDATCKDSSYFYICLSYFFSLKSFFPQILYVLYPDSIIDV